MFYTKLLNMFHTHTHKINGNKTPETFAEPRNQSTDHAWWYLTYAHEITCLCEAEMYNQANNFSIYSNK